MYMHDSKSDSHIHYQYDISVKITTTYCVFLMHLVFYMYLLL